MDNKIHILKRASPKKKKRWVLEYQKEKVLRHHLVQPPAFTKEDNGGPERLRRRSRQFYQVRDRRGPLPVL